MSALEGWARAWLVEPKYVTVFKPTMDVVRHYFSIPLDSEHHLLSRIVSHQELIAEGLPVHYMSHCQMLGKFEYGLPAKF